eukprot:Opistho-2@24233
MRIPSTEMRITRRPVPVGDDDVGAHSTHTTAHTHMIASAHAYVEAHANPVILSLPQSPSSNFLSPQFCASVSQHKLLSPHCFDSCLLSHVQPQRSPMYSALI